MKLLIPFQNIKNKTFKVWEWQSNFILFWASDYLSMLWIKLIDVSKRGPWRLTSFSVVCREEQLRKFPVKIHFILIINTNCCHGIIFVVNGGSISGHKDNLWCYQWRQLDIVAMNSACSAFSFICSACICKISTLEFKIMLEKHEMAIARNDTAIGDI